jgi:hypothetical protein
MRAIEAEMFRDEYPWVTKIFDVEYKSASLDNIIKTCM